MVHWNIYRLIPLFGLRRLRFCYFSSTAEPEHHQAPDFRRWNKNISHLIRIGRLDEAKRVFDMLGHRNSVTWNSMISGYVQRREIAKARKLFDEMPCRDIVSWNLMISGYISCGSGRLIMEARSLFNRMRERDSVSWNTMISGLARNGMMADALDLFHRMPEQNVISWNAMITGFLQNGDVSRAIDMFERMPRRDSASLSALVSGLIRNGELDEAARILLKTGEMTDGSEDLVHAYNTLIAGYGQSRRVEEAQYLFDQMPSYHDQKQINGRFERNVVSWNTMIMCFVKVGDLVSAQRMFDKMDERDAVSWNTMISGYVHASDMEAASNLFGKMPVPDTRSWNLMISGYAQKGDLELSRDFFDRMPQKSLVSWNSMIAGYEQNGNHDEAVVLFSQMVTEGEMPDRHTLSSVLSACAGLTALYQGMQIHQWVIKTVVPDTPITNSLVTMYSRCGAITEAKSIFNDTKLQRDVVSWNAMIGGYAYHGFAGEALMLFEEMKRKKVQPTHITFISVLNACAHAGLVDEGRKHFNSMIEDFGIEPRVEHFASLVDVVGRHGQLKEAMDLINAMQVKPDRAVWGALLGACRMHNNVELAQVAAEALMKLEPESSAPYVLLYNMHADAGRWDDATDVRMVMERNGIRKQTAYSWIELHNKVHMFVAADRTHPLSDEIHALIESYNLIIRDLGLDIFYYFEFD
ncbi:pentatricopeptide repeat-containing protein At1g62260, mitochondrial [Telopea speciosissima]|uniref:pentatricopeptide repeat-containing protein At1g62260, mitochondrial n=1 Tax=Telopea speciosissima TaxID=54955 RepID=UPI001CC4B75C|nr:pentatricopeptide repeat-containing protein At1g62260, mitochondrial [Telopea speciosissima]XP_043693509.1 pentatricopeptide repeat-containing protein At1g62260, mitochondrial [Telopea speciosissima]